MTHDWRYNPVAQWHRCAVCGEIEPDSAIYEIEWRVPATCRGARVLHLRSKKLLDAFEELRRLLGRPQF